MEYKLCVVEEIKRSAKNIDNKLDFAEEVKDICMYFHDSI